MYGPEAADRVFLERRRQILGDLHDAENAARGADNLRGMLRVALSGHSEYPTGPRT